MRRLFNEFVNRGNQREGKFPAQGRPGRSLCEVTEEEGADQRPREGLALPCGVLDLSTASAYFFIWLKSR